MTTKTQASFSNEKYRFLSNFWNFETPMHKVIFLNGQPISVIFKTSESFYMAMKTDNPLLRIKIANCKNGAEAKKIGRSLELREDWEDIKLDVMLYAIRYKFSLANPNLRQKLLATEDSYLQEANWWDDKIWGVCMKTGEGENHLGRVLMQVRSEIKGEQP